MKSFLLLATALLLSSCSIFHAAFGFDVTKGAIQCGTVVGIETWVDNETTMDLKAMTCEEATRTVQMVHDQGAKRGLWPATQTWPGYRLEFINSTNLAEIDSIGSENASGYTLTWSHRIAVAYGYDIDESVKMDLPTDLHSSGVILMHELIHVQENGNMSHCHWASKYAAAFKGLKHEMVETMIDECEHKTCGGSMCWDWAPREGHVDIAP